MKYMFQYRREQRATYTVEADSFEEAEIEAVDQIGFLKLDSTDDESDDPGELEYLEGE